jgi:hypothetical protein
MVEISSDLNSYALYSDLEDWCKTVDIFKNFIRRLTPDTCQFPIMARYIRL